MVRQFIQSKNSYSKAMQIVKRRIVILWMFILALAMQPDITVHAVSGGFTSANVVFHDTGDGNLTATTRVDGSTSSSYYSNHMLVHYYNATNVELGSTLVGMNTSYNTLSRRETITVSYNDVVKSAPNGTVRATLDQCVVLVSGGIFRLDRIGGLTGEDLAQFSPSNDGTRYMSKEGLNQILDKVHAYVPGWCPDGHVYEVFDYHIDLPATAYAKEVRLTVKAGTGILKTYGSGIYEVGQSPVYGGTAITGYNAPKEAVVPNISADTTVTVEGVPWKHQVIYNLNSGEGNFEAFTKTYGQGAYVATVVPVRHGYTFAGWIIDRAEGYAKDESGKTTGSTVPVGTVLNAGTEYPYDQNGGTVTLKAQWFVNSYTLVYHENAGSTNCGNTNTGNSGSRDTGSAGYVEKTYREKVQWADVDDTAIGTTDGEIHPSIGVKYVEELPFEAPISSAIDGRKKLCTGWDLDATKKKPRSIQDGFQGGVEISRHQDQADIVRISDLVNASGLADQANTELHIYAIWDDVPRIEYVQDLYLTSDQAESGITQELLCLALTGFDGSELRVADPEDGARFTFSEDLANLSAEQWQNAPVDCVFLTGYDPEEFKLLGDRQSVSVRFVAVDWAGNYTTATADVHIVSSSVREEQPYVRLIDGENYKKATPEQGGLEIRSLWRTRESYQELLESAISDE